MDKALQVDSKDLLTPGPVIEYEFNGEKHKWITDAWYIPYNLVFDITGNKYMYKLDANSLLDG